MFCINFKAAAGETRRAKLREREKERERERERRCKPNAHDTELRRQISGHIREHAAVAVATDLTH